MTKRKIHNFNAGPGHLPADVCRGAAEAVIELNGSGLSLLEISHRSKEFVEVMERAKSLVRELLGVPRGYSVLFLQGGASLQFIMVPLNLLREGGTAAYINTGVWASGAIKEARFTGNVDVIASSEDKNFSYIPQKFTIPSDVDYLHITSNNTVYGTQYKSFPDSLAPVVCDMSSDIFSRRIDVNRFGLIYAGAQKNMGPAGATLVIVRDDLLGKTGRRIPTMLDYQVHIKKDSLFNTPCVFSVYACMLTLEWLKSMGGVDAAEKINKEKADILYDEIDRNPVFKGMVEKEDRSLMNVTFVLKDPSLEDSFNQMWKDAGIVGIKGHRSVGGYRASLYNAITRENVKALTEVMREFAKKYAVTEKTS